MNESTKVAVILGRMEKAIAIIVLLLATIMLFYIGYSKTNTINSSASTEEALLKKNSHIENIVSFDKDLSGYAVGMRVSELDKFSLDKLQVIEKKGIKIIINAEPTSYVDEEEKTVYISIRSSNEGELIDFVNNLLDKL